MKNEKRIDLLPFPNFPGFSSVGVDAFVLHGYFCSGRRSNNVVIVRMGIILKGLTDRLGELIHRLTRRGMDCPGIQCHRIDHGSNHTFNIPGNLAKTGSKDF